MDAQPVSIDAVVQSSGQASPTSLASPQIHALGAAEALPIAKGKGRKRLLMGLKRIGSSASLGRKRASSSAYKGGAKGSISCISLSSTTASYGSSNTSELSPAFSTAPTSAASTPAPELQFFDQQARVRILGHDTPTSPTSVGLPSDLRPSSPLALSATNVSEAAGDDDYFFKHHHHHVLKTQARRRSPRPNFNFWADLPPEIRMAILSHLSPKHLVRCSSVSKAWHAMCFDGQLWSRLDTSEFYQDIPAPALVSLVTSAGPFIRDLNLRGCVQLKQHWGARGDSTAGFAEVCRNLENFTLEGTEVPRMAIHTLLLQNSCLVHVNLSGLSGATNHALIILAQHCPRLEHLNISWCRNIDTKGVARVIAGCPRLTDLRAGEIVGWDDEALMQDIYETNTLERLVLMATDVTDESLAVLMHGTNPEIDFLTGRPNVPPRRLKHLDLMQCNELSDEGVRSLAHSVPELEGLQLSKVTSLSDASLTQIFPTTPRLTHVDLEELDDVTNASLQSLAGSPCAPWLKHVSVAFCENVGDPGMMAILRSCPRIESLDMDNTRISDLVLTEAAACIRERNRNALANPDVHAKAKGIPLVGMRLLAYDCANVTWMGIREVLSRNADFIRAPPPAPASMSNQAASSSDPESAMTPPPPPPQQQQQKQTQTRGSYPAHIISLKCFYNYQPTVDEHTKRVMRGDWDAARRLERKWAEWMMLNEEAGAAGAAGGRRRRRRAREAMMMHADEEDGGAVGGIVGGFGGASGGRRRRARSGGSGCLVM